MSEPNEPNQPGDADPFSGLLAQAQEALSAQAEAASQMVEGSAGGGVVRVEMTGGGEVTAVHIAPEVVDPNDVEMLQDLIVAALRDAANQTMELQRQALGSIGDMLGGDMLGGQLPPQEG